MKKLLITTILLTFLTACSSDDSQPMLESEAASTPTILGKTYVRSGFIIDTPVDADGDGFYSTDLMQEELCFDLVMTFDEDLNVSNPSFDAVSLYVDDDGNGNLSQRLACSHADGLPSVYKQVDNTIEFYGNTTQELEFTGTLSADESTITIQFANEYLFGFNFFSGGNNILLQDGTIFEYQGDATVIYTLQE